MTGSDAVVIGSGPNGLVAANMLADRGWDVVVVEASDHPGGAVWSSSFIEDGFINDHCSAFYPLGAGSPVMQAMELDRHGLKWRRSPLVLAHASVEGDAPALSMSLDETAEILGPDGNAWRELYREWSKNSDAIVSALFTPFPPVRAGARLAWAYRGDRGRDLLRFARLAVLPVRRLGDERFSTDGARKLLAGLALHADLLPEAPLSGFFGWLLASLGHSVGFPVPEGGAGNLTRALVRRFESRGGTMLFGREVSDIVVRGGRAVAVRCADGTVLDVERAVLADVSAPALYTKLLPEDSVPAGVRDDIDKFQFDDATVKVDWTLDGPIPWADGQASRAGTVHVGEGMDQLSESASLLARGRVPDHPFLLLGQYSMLDPSRQPAGKETAWAYTHVPFSATWNGDSMKQFVDTVEAEIERRAPGFRALIRKRHVLSPEDFEAGNSNLVHGALGGGTSQLHQQLVFRPIPGPGRPETPVKGLFLASSSAHPGGGVHGACGANAAKAALFHDRLRPRRSRRRR